MKLKSIFFTIALLFSIQCHAQSVIANNVYSDYGSVSVGTGAAVQLIASLNSQVTSMYSFDSSGLPMKLIGTCKGIAQVVNLSRGGNGQQPGCFDVGTSLSIQSLSGTASTSGTEIILNLFH